MIAQSERNDKFRTIKADILTRYEDYLLSEEKLQFQYKITKDAFEAYSKAEIDFKNNLIKIEDLNSFNTKYVDEQIKRLELQRNFNVARIDIEKLIGVRLEDVITMVQKY